MDTLLTLLVGIAAGAYYADEIRSVAPVLDRNKETS